MFKTKIATVLVLSAAAAALPALAFAAPPDSPAHCILKQHRVTAVQPLNAPQTYGRSSTMQLVGARVLVEAEQGLTAEWLQLSIQRHMVQMGSSGMKNCALDAKDVRVSVKSAGVGFAIEITGKDATQAQEILRRAKLLAG
jgi:hypothetical protein